MGKKGTTVTREFIIVIAVMFMAMLGIIMVYRMMTPSLETSLEGRAEWTARELSVYMSGLSAAEEGEIDKNLGGLFDIIIKYNGGRNYEIKVVSYREKKESDLYGSGSGGGGGASRIVLPTGQAIDVLRKTEGDEKAGDWVPFVAELEIPNAQQKEIQIVGVEFISISKAPGQPVRLNAQNGLIFCKEPTKEEIMNVLDSETVGMEGVQNPKALIKALWSQETSFHHCDGNNVMVSETNNVGMGMIGKSVAEEYGFTLQDMYDPVINMRVSILKVKKDAGIFRDYGETEQLLVAYYNCGTAILNLAREHCTAGEEKCWELIKDKIGPGQGACTRMASDGRPETVVHVENVMKYYEMFRTSEYRDCYSHPIDCKEGYV